MGRLADADRRDRERGDQDHGHEDEHELGRAIPKEQAEERRADLAEHVEDREHGPDAPALARRHQVGHEREVRIDGDVEEERVHREHEDHRDERREAGEKQERRRGEADADDEEGPPSADPGSRPVGD